MKSFVQVAIPHEDIIKGYLSMDVFAADLWQVANGKAKLVYQDPDLFFKKTYITKGLNNILDVAKLRIEGKIGDSVIQLQTPFGGGKTHTLIALYHKAKEWNAKVAVIDGTALDIKERKIWEELERQITGRISLTRGDISPGKEKLIEIISNNSPILILMDEVLNYITKAATVKIGDSNLASQTLVFIQELTAAVSSVGNSLLVISLPSSTLEHPDENAERIYQQLQKITGRVEKIYTPVQDDEIESVVRKRLFNEIDEIEAKNIVDDFVDYAKNEGLLSQDESLIYREKFLKSYPFKPEIIDVLYKRWGSIPTFQRTRGVLRLLSLVIYNLIENKIPFIRLGDFDLSNEELRRELINHIGPEYDSIIAQDITSKNSGSKIVDENIGLTYKPYKLGTVVSTTIFMMSHAGKEIEKGVNIKDLKLYTIYKEIPSSIIDTVITNLKEKLFYLSDEGLLFTNKPNLNRIIISREENIDSTKLYEKEKDILKNHLKKSLKNLKIYIHPNFSRDIPDNKELKLIILNKEKPDLDFLEKCGESPRIYRNTLIFLCIDENQKLNFYNFLRKFIAYEEIDKDSSLNLTEAQKKEIKIKIRDYENREYEELRKFYRKLFLPERGDFKEYDLGIPSSNESYVDEEIYNFLLENKLILNKIAPKLIKEKYLSENNYVEINKLFESFLKTPGELRLISQDAFIESLKEGVKNGEFGFGYLEDNNIKSEVIKEYPNITFSENEIIIKPESFDIVFPPQPKIEPKDIEDKGKEKSENVEEIKYKEIYLDLIVPEGQVSTIPKILNYIKDNFREIKIIINAKDGNLKKSDYEDKILESLKQSNYKIIKEEKK